jgi:3-methyladenine DNA glycosylase AlkD
VPGTLVRKMSHYLQPLVDNMAAAANAENAVQMAAYMRDQFPFLGIKSPERRKVLSAFLKEAGLPDAEDMPAVARALWDLPEREHQYSAMDILRRGRKKLGPEFVSDLEWLITTKSWWDTVDGLAGWIAGALFNAYPEVRAETVSRWREQENIWLRRTTLLFQLKYKDRTDAPLLFSLIEQNLDDGEFFIQKAIGWALREYSKTDETAVRDFVARTELSPLGAREALKWLNNQERKADG